jgi:hypothetical protein
LHSGINDFPAVIFPAQVTPRLTQQMFPPLFQAYRIFQSRADGLTVRPQLDPLRKDPDCPEL